MQSPCIGRCDPNSAICPGCGRSDKEICNWMFFTDDERAAIMQRLNDEGFGREQANDTDEQSGGPFGRKGNEWKLPPINKI